MWIRPIRQVLFALSGLGLVGFCPAALRAAEIEAGGAVVDVTPSGGYRTSG